MSEAVSSSPHIPPPHPHPHLHPHQHHTIPKSPAPLSPSPVSAGGSRTTSGITSSVTTPLTVSTTHAPNTSSIVISSPSPILLPANVPPPPAAFLSSAAASALLSSPSSSSFAGNDSASPPASSKGLRRMGSVKKQPFFMNLRIQLIDQMKTLDTRLETQVQLTNEIQEFFKKRAEVEMETSRALEKLAKNLNTRHKEIKAKRDSSSSSATSTLTSSTHHHTPILSSSLSQTLGQQGSLQPWTVFNSQSSLSVCWQQLINDTKMQSQNHATLADIYSTEITQRLQSVSEDLQRIYKQCREIGLEAHEELLKVLHELHTSMKTYHTYQTETRIAEAKLKLVEAQRAKLEQQIPKEKLEKSKKMKLVEKEVQKRMHKFTDARFKSQKAKNEYILCMDAANAAVQKYFMEDLSDLIDCMDLGFYECVTRSLNMYVSSQDQIRKSLQSNMETMSKCVTSLDSRLDKQKFLESHNTVFALPKKFEFVSPVYPNNKNTASIAEEDFTPDPSEIETSGFIRQELEQRVYQLHKRLDTLRIESDELWKTLETAENSLLEMITAKDYDTCSYFIERNNRVTSNEAAVAKIRSDKVETDEFHLNKFRDYMLTMNRISRLQSKYEHIRKALKTSDPSSLVLPPTSSTAAVASTRQYNRRKRIGQIQKFTNTRLFGGSIEEYLEATNQDIPLVMKSCIRVINLYGLQHQGIFRVSGSQVEINNFKEAFEKGEDPLADVTDASDINSVAGVFKLYLRELREPLFPVCYFEQFMELAQLDSNNVFMARMRDLVKSLPRAVFIVLRYLFAFLNHLSEYSDENMMDPYNLAICFGPTLVPVPEDKDQVQYQNLVNELIKNVILFHDEIFVDIQDGVMYEKYISTSNNEDEHDDGHQQSQHQGSTASKSFMSESSPVLKKSLSCVEGGGGRGHSREDSNSSSLRAHTPSSVAATALMSEEAPVLRRSTSPPASPPPPTTLVSTSPLPNPPLSPVIKETVILNDDEDEDEDPTDFHKKSDFLEAVAQFDFTARSPRELSLKKGETLVLYAQVSSDWWKGSNKEFKEGLIPDKYILLKIRDEDVPVPPSTSSASSTPTSSSSVQVVPPPLMTPPNSSTGPSSSTSTATKATTAVPTVPPAQQQQPEHHQHHQQRAINRTRTASDSLLIHNPAAAVQQQRRVDDNAKNHHQRSFSVSDERKSTSSSISSVGGYQNGHDITPPTGSSAEQNGNEHEHEDMGPPPEKIAVENSSTGNTAMVIGQQQHRKSTSPSIRVVPQPMCSQSGGGDGSSSSNQKPGPKASSTTANNCSTFTASPSMPVKSNIQVWEQRTKVSSSSSPSSSSPPLQQHHHSPNNNQQHQQSSAPDLVMDLPTQQQQDHNPGGVHQIQNPGASSATTTSSHLLHNPAATTTTTSAAAAPIPPKFTDTSPSSSDESDSSEASSSASSSPSTPTSRIGSSGAEVFAKQKNATLKKRTQFDDGTSDGNLQNQPQQPLPWSSGGGGGDGAVPTSHHPPPPAMFTFSSTFNKPQVKVKPVVLSKPKLPSQFTTALNKMDEDNEEMVVGTGGEGGIGGSE